MDAELSESKNGKPEPRVDRSASEFLPPLQLNSAFSKSSTSYATESSSLDRNRSQTCSAGSWRKRRNDSPHQAWRNPNYSVFNDQSSKSHYDQDNGFKHMSRRRHAPDGDNKPVPFTRTLSSGPPSSGRGDCVAIAFSNAKAAQFSRTSSADNISNDRCGSYVARTPDAKQIKFVLAGKTFSDDIHQDEQKVKHVGYKYIQNLIDKMPFEIPCEVLKSNSPFVTFLNEPELEADWLMLVVKILKKACSSSYTENINEMLSLVLRSKLMHAIAYYLSDVESETSAVTIGNLEKFLTDLTDLFSSITNILPHRAVERDLKKVILKTIKACEKVNVEFGVRIDENLKKTLETLIQKIDNYKEIEEKKNLSTSAPQRSYLDRLSDMAPPDNFRNLSLHPTSEDLMRSTFGFIRPNKTKGAYDDVHHYLDVQFRLLREDFIDPLRTGLKQYMETTAAVPSGGARKVKYKYESVRFYRKTRFERSSLTKSHELGFLLIFDANQRMKIKWECSKRFMYGSLLLFTSDNFQTFFLGTVLERDIKTLETGRVLVKLPSEVEKNQYFFEREFLMAESEVFFEPYHLVMKRLQLMKEEDFPMPKYIVYGNTNTEKPLYLREATTLDMFGHRVNPMRDDAWPAASKLGMDESQYAAFKNALLSNFSVIQGPPGTGKTFIGLKIMQLLLENIKNDFLGVNLPILIVAYTNHALDQFLEEILSFTDNIVRAGSRSCSQIMQSYHLRGQCSSEARREAQTIYEAKGSVVREVEKLNSEIKRLSELRNETQTPRGILRHELLSNVMNDYQKENLKCERDVQHWLLPMDGTEYVNRYETQFQSCPEQSMTDARVENDSDGKNKTDYEFREDDALFDELLKFNVPLNVSPYSLTIDDLKTGLENNTQAQGDLTRWMSDPVSPHCYFDDDELTALKCQLQDLYEEYWWKTREFKLLQNQLKRPQFDPQQSELLSAKNIFQLSIDQRWVLYWSWVAKIRRCTITKLIEVEKDYATKLTLLNEYKLMEDVFVVQKADVVGMTTTCAARLHLVLETVKPSIVIIEEAAEVLEAHIVSSLTEACEHVILIGDHKQLKPSTAVYQLCKKFNLDVSLFERMINNGMYCPMLRIQHRMRPEISKLITPLIYPDLKDHETVENYSQIRGVSKSLFFLEHNEFEAEVEDSSSRTNLFEVEFLLKLCEHLLYQGYSQSDITILTTYTGQMYLIREKLRQSHHLGGVDCFVVDKFQGEENKIILLSLVRSNKEAKIGFLKTENRVCVALSRAKKGLYIVGNMDNLCASSELWQEIRKTLQQGGAIGRAIQLYCEKHAYYTSVSKVADFDKVSQGGCNTACAELLKCGHACPSVCHRTEHNNVLCFQPCPKLCPRLHPCKLYCHEPCKPCDVLEKRTLPCGHEKILPCHQDENQYCCVAIVDDVSPVCQHAIQRKCGEAPTEARCDVPCGARLDCGHVCPKKCHKNEDPEHLEFDCRRPCGRLNEKCTNSHHCKKLCFEDCGLCTVSVWRTLPCGHGTNLECSADLSNYRCREKCNKSCAECKGKCRKKCFENCAPCFFKVEKKIEECGHFSRVECSAEATRKNCTQPCERMLPCGHLCKALCRESCESKTCEQKVRKEGLQGVCGHNFIIIPCFQQNKVESLDKKQFLSSCDEPCGATLKCGDFCSGNCGSCMQGRMHQNCDNDCGSLLICGHVCKVKCREICPPCNEKCNFRCKHSSCRRTCGIPCVQCEELCKWGCKHSKCTKKCGEICNRKACYEACEKTLICGHLCIGYCGEPCPPLCRECNPEITEILFGWEDEPNARFVLLEDCGHTVESKALDKHLLMPQEGGEIVMKTCPLCKTPIVTTLRYANIVKETFRHILNVKSKIFGNPRTREVQHKELLSTFENFKKSYEEIIRLADLKDLRNTIDQFVSVLQCKRGRGKWRSAKWANISVTELSAVRYCGHVLDVILSRLGDLSVCFEREVTAGSKLQRRWVPERMTIIDKKLDTSVTAKKNLEFLRWLLPQINTVSSRVNQQRSQDINREVCRFVKMVDFCVILRDPKYIGNEKNEDVRTMCGKIEEILFGFARFTPEQDETVKNLLQDFSKHLEINNSLTEEEKRSIHLAMSKDFYGGSQSKGHWFTCSRGHYYCITECGGAMEESKCPECGEKIGGQNHRYVDTIRVASDIDGATRPAWSSGLDLRNYGNLE